MSVIFINRYFFPDHSATSQVLSDIAFALAAGGETVHVITSRQRYDRPNEQLPAEERVNDVHIHRVKTSRFGRSRLLGRSIDYVSFYLAARRALAEILSPNDLVVAKTDPPLLSLAVLSVVRRRHAHLINWLQDLYPEVAIASSMVWLRGPIGRVLAYLRDRSLDEARANVVVGRHMAQRLVSRGIRNETIRLITNFAADDQIRPVAHADNPLRKEWGLEDKFVVAYSGNLGRVHEFATILDAASRLKSEPRIVFLCIGGGAGFERLADAVGELGLRDKFLFRPYQPREALRYSLSAADVHWVSLRPEFEGLVVPSKLYGIAAAQRPIIAIAAKDGELGDLVRRHQCGVVIEPGDGSALAASLIEMMNSPSLCAELGSRARKALEDEMSKEQAIRRWRELLIEVRRSATGLTPR